MELVVPGINLPFKGFIENVFPMIPGGKGISEMILSEEL